VNPEQSNPEVVVPPYTYLTPRYSRAELMSDVEVFADAIAGKDVEIIILANTIKKNRFIISHIPLSHT